MLYLCGLDWSEKKHDLCVITPTDQLVATLTIPLRFIVCA